MRKLFYKVRVRVGSETSEGHNKCTPRNLSEAYSIYKARNKCVDRTGRAAQAVVA